MWRKKSMNPAQVLLLSFLIGVVTGLRSLTAPAVVTFAAHRGWINLHNTPLSFMGATPAFAIFALLALGELIADKLPSTPSRTAPLGLIARVLLGGLCGACLAVAGAQSLALGALLGVAGGLLGTFGGYQLRTGLVKALKVPDFVIALAEDALAIGGGLFIVSRF
jgi:uncharacterized membrane protein